MIDFRALVQQPALQALGWTLLHFLWQGAALGFVAFLLLRAARPARASTRYAIGVATLALMLASCTATFITLSHTAASPQSRVTPSVMPASSIQSSMVTGLLIADFNVSPTARSLFIPARQDATPLRPQRLGPVPLLLIVAGWSLGVLILSFRLVGGWMLTRRLARRAIDTVSPTLEFSAREIGIRLRLRRGVEILESTAVAVPTLVGWVKPVVLFPASALAGLSPEQLQAILAHELAHVRRHDYLINLLQSVVETLLFYHPAVWWVSAQVREEREHCCDDLAVEVCGDRVVYVSALAQLTTIAGDRGFALAATDGSLLGRVRRILGGQRPTHETPPVWTALAMLVVVVGSAGAFGASNDEPTRARDIELQRPMTANQVFPPPPPPSPPVLSPFDLPAVPPEPPTPPLAPESSLSPLPPEPPSPPALLRSWIAPPAPPAPATPLAWPAAPPAPPTPLAWPAAPTPAALPAPPASPAPAPPPGVRDLEPPPAPPEPPAVAPVPPVPPPPRAEQTGTNGNLVWTTDHEKLSVKWNGAFRLSDDKHDIAWVEEGATVTITDGLVLASRADVRGQSRGQIERRFSKNGFKRDWEPEGRLFLAQALEKLVRQSGMFARDRVARFLKQGGPDAVLDEISRLANSSYVRRVYYTELLEQAPLTEPLLSRVLRRVQSDLTNDYDRAMLFVTATKLPTLTDPHRATIARGARMIGSDYDQRRTLSAVMQTDPVSPEVAAAVLEATATVNSSHDRANILIELAQRSGVTSSTSAAFMDLVRAMSSSYDQRRVLTAVAGQQLPGAVAAEAVKVADAMKSSHDQAETLLEFIERGNLTDSSADSFFASAAEISSSPDLGRVLKAVVAQPQSSDRFVEGVLKAAASISSSYDRSSVLVELATTHRLSDAARDLYVTAAQDISSSSDQNRALAALARAERR